MENSNQVRVNISGCSITPIDKDESEKFRAAKLKAFDGLFEMERSHEHNSKFYFDAQDRETQSTSVG